MEKKLKIPNIPMLKNIEPLSTADKSAFGRIFKGFHPIEKKNYVVKILEFTDEFDENDAINEA